MQGGLSGMANRLQLLLLLTLPTFAGWAEEFRYEEGVHFARLEVPVETGNPDAVEVTEYFSYGCPHCYQFEPWVRRWTSELPEDVVFNRTPAVWQGYELYARTYYTAQALGVLDQVHTSLFQALHSEGRHISDLKSMALFVSEQGVDMERFIKTFTDSFGVKAMYQQAIARQRIYRATSVPVIIVNGKYRIAVDMAGGTEEMLHVADYLVERERRLLKGQ